MVICTWPWLKKKLRTTRKWAIAKCCLVNFFHLAFIGFHSLWFLEKLRSKIEILETMIDSVQM